MNKDKQAAGVPICDDALETVSGGMRVQATDLVFCPVCGGTNTPYKKGNGSIRVCNAAGCGTIFNCNTGEVVGVDSVIANKK